MNYPTLQQVNEADIHQLSEWYRFLDSPGARAIGEPEFQEVLKSEKPIMDRIYDRFHALGGMTTEVSKSLGWGRR